MSGLTRDHSAATALLRSVQEGDFELSIAKKIIEFCLHFSASYEFEGGTTSGRSENNTLLLASNIPLLTVSKPAETSSLRSRLKVLGPLEA
jgi:hypothetical protein